MRRQSLEVLLLKWAMVNSALYIKLFKKGTLLNPIESITSCYYESKVFYIDPQPVLPKSFSHKPAEPSKKQKQITKFATAKKKQSGYKKLLTPQQLANLWHQPIASKRRTGCQTLQKTSINSLACLMRMMMKPWIQFPIYTITRPVIHHQSKIRAQIAMDETSPTNLTKNKSSPVKKN